MQHTQHQPYTPTNNKDNNTNTFTTPITNREPTHNATPSNTNTTQTLNSKPHTQNTHDQQMQYTQHSA